MDKPQLTRHQEMVLDFVKGYIAKSGYPPSTREIARSLGFGSQTSSVRALQGLQRKGYIRRDCGNTRGIRVIGGEREYIRTLKDLIVHLASHAQFASTGRDAMTQTQQDIFDAVLLEDKHRPK